MPINATTIDALFSGYAVQQELMGNLAKSALSRGADLSLSNDYAGAAGEFKRAVGLDPSPDNAATAYDLLATVYLQQDKTDDAIAAYKTSISISPNNDETHMKLGSIYFGEKRYVEAESEYKTAVRISPTSSANVLALGQAYLATNRFAEAETQFKQVIRLSPNHHAGYYALGQAYAQEGRNDEAIDEFNKAVSLKNDFFDAHVDLGYAYAELGLGDNAREQLAILNDNAPDLAGLLADHLYFSSSPKFIAAFSATGFIETYGPGTSLDAIDSSFSSPNASKEFTVIFKFSKEMDLQSVQNTFNWSIGRAPGSFPGGGYNWGLPVPSTEVSLLPVPTNVIYFPDTLMAAVSFKVGQNATSSGAIDPYHLLFSFSGSDAYGKKMDLSADQYSGISKIV